ncbi:MAG: VIT domain-containing protein [Pseudomonadota bacterium]
MRRMITSCLAASVALVGLVAAGPGNAAGLLHPKGATESPLELRAHMVDVVVEDGYVVTHVEQIFANAWDTDLEAIYSFPVPEDAAVSAFTYWIDDKPVHGEVVEKKRAREIYERERDAGREAAVTEQDDYRSFDISVTPVRAHDDVRIRLSYIQPAHVDMSIGRYTYPLEDGGTDEAKLSFWGTQSAVQEYFRFGMWVRPAVPLAGLRLPAHPQAQVNQEADGSYRVLIESGQRPAIPGARMTATLDEEESVDQGGAATGQFGTVEVPAPGGAHAFDLDEDIVVYWRLQDGLPGGVDVVANRPDPAEPGTFMLTVTPGDELKPLSQTGADWIFVVDISGSMGGKIHSVKEGLAQAFEGMRPNDRAQIVVFDNEVATLTRDFIDGSPASVRTLKSKAASIATGGGTNLFAGLDRGLALADADRSTALILITDGVANVGETDHNKFIELIEKKDVRLFTFVMGNGTNRPLLESMTRASAGESFSVSNSDDIIGHVRNAVAKLQHEALRDVRVSIDGVGARAMSPANLGTLYSGKQLTVFGRYAHGGQATLKVSGKINGRPQVYESVVTFPDVANENPEIDRLWYFSRIEELMEQLLQFGESGERVDAVVDLAVEGGLVTPYTSMLVVRDEVFASEGIDRRNEARVAEEQVAQTARAARQVVTRDAQVAGQPQPYQGARPSHSGGGGGTGGGNVGLLGLLLAWFTQRFGKARCDGVAA